MPGVPVYSLLLVCFLSMQSAREAAGAAGIRHSPRPQGREINARLGRFALRDRDAYLELEQRHCERSEAIQTYFVAVDLLRGACHRARIRATRSLAMTSLQLNCLGCLKIKSGICIGGALALPLWERVGVRGHGLSIGRNPSPGSHLSMRHSRSFASASFFQERPPKAAYALPQGER